MGGLLYTKLKAEGYTVYKKSAYRNILLRYLDTVWAVLFCKYDILFIQGFALRAFYLESMICRIGKWRHKKIVYNIHGGAFPEFYQNNIQWCDSVLQKVDCIVTPSQYIQVFLQSQNYPVTYIPNFIELDTFPFNWQYTGAHTLLWVRSFHPIYKPELAIKAIQLIKQQYPDIQLTMVGPDQGSLADSVALIQSLQLQDHITITGPVANATLTQYYCSHAIFITTTTYESFGVSLIEAASSGIPMVSTSVGEIPYLWQTGETILLVPDNDVTAFAKTITNLLSNQNLQLNLSVAARKKAEHYTWAHIQSKWKNILQ